MNTTQSAIGNQSLTSNRLAEQNAQYHGTGGVSSSSRRLGFVPGFKDLETGKVYRSCYADGRPAPLHILEGLPSELHIPVHTESAPASTVVKCSVVAGFLLNDIFYSREQAAQAISGLRVVSN